MGFVGDGWDGRMDKWSQMVWAAVQKASKIDEEADILHKKNSRFDMDP